MSTNEVVSRDQFGKYSAADLSSSPARPTVAPADVLSEQWAGLPAAAPKDPEPREPNYIGEQTIHQYRSNS